MKRAWKAVLAGLFVAAIALPATAVPLVENFGSWNPESPLTDAQADLKGWDYDYEAARDVELVASGIDGGKSIRMSNAVTDGAFDDWLYSQKIAPVYEGPSATDGNEFIASFDIKKTTTTYEPGLQISVSPQSGIVNGAGARMSFLRFEDSPGGIDVLFVDNQDDDGINQRAVYIAEDLDPAIKHNVKFVLDLYAGPHNDVVQVFIDNDEPRIPMLGEGFTGFFAPVDNPSTANKVKAGQSVPMKWKFGGATPATTWEDYYRFTPESNADPVQVGGDPVEMLPQVDGQWPTRPVDSLIFQARSSGGTRVNTTFGGGYFVDNVSLDSSATTTLPKGGPAGAFPGDASIYGSQPFTYQTVNCDGTDLDTLETADAPGASHLTYDAATGIWHYNWQTTKQMVGQCVKLTLTATGNFALFKISK